jgi:hypothetical protein
MPNFEYILGSMGDDHAIWTNVILENVERHHKLSFSRTRRCAVFALSLKGESNK